MPVTDLYKQASYVYYFEGWTVNAYPPEPFYIGILSGWSFPTEVTVQDVYQGWQVAGMFNPKFFADLLINNVTNAPTWETHFGGSTGVP